MSSANSILVLFHTKGLSLTLSLLTFDYLENLRCSHHLNPCLIKAPAYSLIRSDLWRSKKGGEKVKMYFVVKRACLPSSSLLNMHAVCAPRINEPELEQ